MNQLDKKPSRSRGNASKLLIAIILAIFLPPAGLIASIWFGLAARRAGQFHTALWFLASGLLALFIGTFIVVGMGFGVSVTHGIRAAQ